MVFNFYESLTVALSKGAKTRVMAKNTELRSGTRQKLENLNTHPNFEVKYAQTPFDFGLAILNRREVNIAISTKEVPSLWTNNRQIVKISEMMFENQWNAESDTQYICQHAESVKVNQ
jgi:sugar-specific transcriptional regulator TrmB